MRGKKTDRELIAEIAELLKLHRPADIVTIMAGRLPRRTVYRIIAKLKAKDEKRKLKEEEQFRESMYQQTTSRLKIWQSRKRYKSSDFPPNLRRVRSF
jgi:transcription initiation factor TFIID subunit TAF12